MKPKRKTVKAWALVYKHRGARARPIRVFWSRAIAREEAKGYGGALFVRVIKCDVAWGGVPSK